MKRLEQERVAAGLSKAKLGRLADVNPAIITWAEQRGFELYSVQLQRLAAALSFDGDPAKLLEEVSDGAAD